MEEQNIKKCVDNIKDGFNKSYNTQDSYVMLRTKKKNVFVIAVNYEDELYDVFVSDWWSTKNIQKVDKNIKTTIIDALSSIIHILDIKNPEGQKIVVCYIENQGSEEKYNFIRLYVSNQDPKADYKLENINTNQRI